MDLNLKRPLVFFDLETTGISTSTDRIIELCLIKVYPDGKEETLNHRVNPTIPIPADSSAIHGIFDADVADKPTFKELAHELNRFLDNCDFAGFNSNRFDFPMLVEEFFRADVEFEIEHRKFIDVQRIFHVMEPRNLAAAYRFYCNMELENAHSAEADTRATLDVFKAQLQKYDQLEKDIDALHKVSGQSNLVDLAGRIILNDKGQEVFNFGKHKGKLVAEVFKREPTYYDWMMNGDFPRQTKQVITRLRLKQFNNK
jgi:DNA polymerase III subunit epsilon